MVYLNFYRLQIFIYVIVVRILEGCAALACMRNDKTSTSCRAADDNSIGSTRGFKFPLSDARYLLGESCGNAFPVRDNTMTSRGCEVSTASLQGGRAYWIRTKLDQLDRE